MRSADRRWAVGAASVVVAAVVAGCGSSAAVPAVTPPAPSTSDTPPASTSPPSPGRHLLLAQATVLDHGQGPQLCVGAVASSYPPQCGGPPVVGWTWPARGTEREGKLRWGSFFVVGTYAHGRFAVDRLVTREQAAASLPPSQDPGPSVSSATHPKAELERVRAQLSDEPGLLSSWTEQGVVVTQVVYDDGTLQREDDRRFGARLVHVESALHPYVG